MSELISNIQSFLLDPLGFSTFCIVLSGFFFFIVFPIVFHFKIIPDIERRLGRKIERWGVLVEMWALGKYTGAHLEVANFAVHQYFLVKLCKNSDKAIEKFNKRRKPLDTDLARLGYDVRQAPKFEIIMSFLVVVSLMLIVIGIAVFQFYVFPNKPL